MRAPDLKITIKRARYTKWRIRGVLIAAVVCYAVYLIALQAHDIGQRDGMKIANDAAWRDDIEAMKQLPGMDLPLNTKKGLPHERRK